MSTTSTPGDEVILRTLWGLRPFRESFLDSHKSLVRNTSSTERQNMLRVQSAFATAFSSMRFKKNNKKEKKDKKDKKKRKKKKKKKKSRWRKNHVELTTENVEIHNEERSNITEDHVMNDHSSKTASSTCSSSEDDDSIPTLVPHVNVTAIKELLNRAYTHTMDGRTGTSSLLYDMLYMLHDPPEERGSIKSLSSLNLSGGGDTFVVNDVSIGEGKRSKKSSRKRPKETWDLSNMFRHEVRVEWTKDLAVLAETSGSCRNSTVDSSSSLLQRTPRQLEKRKGNLLPNGSFRFWHVIDVGTMLDLHDEITRHESSVILEEKDREKKSKEKRGKTGTLVVDDYDGDDEKDNLGFREKARKEVFQEEVSMARKITLAAEERAKREAEEGFDKKLKKREVKKDAKKDVKKEVKKEEAKKEEAMKEEAMTEEAMKEVKESNFFCGSGREKIIEHIKNDSHPERIRGYGDLSYVMRELLQLEAYEEMQRQGKKDLIERPIFKLNIRPNILCIRLEWPSTNQLKSERISINGKKLIWDTITMKHLCLYDCFDIIGGKRKDNRTPYNTKACTYTLTNVICSSLGISHDSKMNKNSRKKKIKKNNTIYYGMSRIRKNRNVGDDEDAWKLMLMGGDVMDSSNEYDDGKPKEEAMIMKDLQRLCHERLIYPEFLFFESNGPTHRDLKRQEREHRVSSSTILEASVPPTITTARSSHYGTIAQNKDDEYEYQDGPSLSNGNLEAHWCEGTSCTIV